MTISLNMLQTMGLAVIFLLLGQRIRKKVQFFETYCIPSPVIGGLIFAIIHLMIRSYSSGGFEFDETLKNFFMNMFFTTIGFNASFKTLKKSGLEVIKFLFIATLLAVLQNILALLLAPVVKMPPLLALMTGSTAMTGGHGTSGGIAPHVEELGMMGAQAVAIVSATFGLIAGSLMGGPLANSVIQKFSLMKSEAEREKMNLNEPKEKAVFLNQDTLLMAFVQILIAMGIGVYVSALIEKTGLHFPSYIGGMLVAVVMRNVSDKGIFVMPMKEISTVGNVSLNLFLAEALLTLRLWELAGMALPLLILLLAQVLLVFIFVRFITFPLMGKDYDAAVISAGHCGFGMGATPNGMANMVSVSEKYGYSEKAFFVLPLVGALFIDFTNVAQIELLINYLL